MLTFFHQFWGQVILKKSWTQTFKVADLWERYRSYLVGGFVQLGESWRSTGPYKSKSTQHQAILATNYDFGPTQMLQHFEYGIMKLGNGITKLTPTITPIGFWDFTLKVIGPLG